MTPSLLDLFLACAASWVGLHYGFRASVRIRRAAASKKRDYPALFALLCAGVVLGAALFLAVSSLGLFEAARRFPEP